MKKAKSPERHFIARIGRDVDEAVDQALEFVEQGDFAKGERLLVRRQVVDHYRNVIENERARRLNG